MSKKLRILVCNDAHFLHTGYGNYGRNILTRLAATDKYILGELACYGQVNDEQDMYANWMYYANHVPADHPLYNQYASHPQNEFGRWRFERVCLDFRPHIVTDWRDPWCLTFEEMSPLRPYYHWVIMPTVDSAPQKNEWLETFYNADAVFTYTDWGKDVLDKESNKQINTISSAPPGCDTDIFKPVQNKEEHRVRMGFFKDANIVGTIMRNQVRKLYPDLFQAFRRFLDICYETGNVDLANNTYLYVHTSYPDVGWEIPELLIEHELGRKVIFTYICQKCDTVTCSFFKGARGVCTKCNSSGAILPNTVVGLSPEQLAQIINTFDLYIQYSVAEGFGIPKIEAASCGVPVMAVDYSAMSDIIRKLKGTPLKVERMFRDIGTNAYRALPDNEYCAKKIFEFFKKPRAIQRRMGNMARKGVEQYYTWDRTAAIWENYFDNVKLTGLQGKWDTPQIQMQNIPPVPENLSNAEFIDWVILNVMQEPRYLNSRFAMKLLNDLNYGGYAEDRKIMPVTRQSIYKMLFDYAQNKLECEKARTGKIQLQKIDFIEYAHQRAKYLL